eukprot:jgi/Botrbrau1/7178/Bobra.0300s0008.1
MHRSSMTGGGGLSAAVPSGEPHTPLHGKSLLDGDAAVYRPEMDWHLGLASHFGGRPGRFEPDTVGEGGAAEWSTGSNPDEIIRGLVCEREGPPFPHGAQPSPSPPELPPPGCSPRSVAPVGAASREGGEEGRGDAMSSRLSGHILLTPTRSDVGSEINLQGPGPLAAGLLLSESAGSTPKADITGIEPLSGSSTRVQTPHRLSRFAGDSGSGGHWRAPSGSDVSVGSGGRDDDSTLTEATLRDGFGSTTSIVRGMSALHVRPTHTRRSSVDAESMRKWWSGGRRGQTTWRAFTAWRASLPAPQLAPGAPGGAALPRALRSAPNPSSPDTGGGAGVGHVGGEDGPMLTWMERSEGSGTSGRATPPLPHHLAHQRSDADPWGGPLDTTDPRYIEKEVETASEGSDGPHTPLRVDDPDDSPADHSAVPRSPFSTDSRFDAPRGSRFGRPVCVVGLGWGGPTVVDGLAPQARPVLRIPLPGAVGGAERGSGGGVRGGGPQAERGAAGGWGGGGPGLPRGLRLCHGNAGPPGRPLSAGDGGGTWPRMLSPAFSPSTSSSEGRRRCPSSCACGCCPSRRAWCLFWTGPGCRTRWSAPHISPSVPHCRTLWSCRPCWWSQARCTP